MTQGEPTLEALLRRMSRGAAQCFAEHAEIAPNPIYLVENESGKQRIVGTPINGSPFEVATSRQARYDALRRQFRDWKIRRYVRAMECWRAPLPPANQEQTYAALGYTLANAPEREEVVMIVAEDGRQFLLGWRAIIRPPGQNPYPCKLVIDKETSFGGVGAGLLQPDKPDA